jgi:hypothetical protein
MTSPRFLPVLATVLAFAPACGSDPQSTQKLDSAVYLDTAVPAPTPDAAPDQAVAVVEVGSGVDGAVVADAGAGVGDTAVDAGAGDASVMGADAATADAPTTISDAGEDGGALELDAAPDAVDLCGKLPCDCMYKGKLLRGPVVYQDFPYDISVFVVTNNLADLYVQEVVKFGLTNKCGQWDPAHPLPTLRVRKARALAEADFTIQYVNDLRPGLPGRR